MADVMSIRMSAAQTMLRVLKDTSGDTQPGRNGSSSSSPHSSSYLLQSFGVGSTTEDIRNDKPQIQPAIQQTTAAEAKPEAEEPPPTGIGSKSFMTALKARLEEMKSTPDGKLRAREMLEALAAGTLTVTDAENRKTLKAWDVGAESGTSSKPTEEIDAAGWSDFLKERLTRGGNSTYLIGANGAYIDKLTGESAYFGTIGETYAYLSWPAAGTDA